MLMDELIKILNKYVLLNYLNVSHKKDPLFENEQYYLFTLSPLYSIEIDKQLLQLLNDTLPPLQVSCEIAETYVQFCVGPDDVAKLVTAFTNILNKLTHVEAIVIEEKLPEQTVAPELKWQQELPPIIETIEPIETTEPAESITNPNRSPRQVVGFWGSRMEEGEINYTEEERLTMKLHARLDELMKLMNKRTHSPKVNHPLDVIGYVSKTTQFVKNQTNYYINDQAAINVKLKLKPFADIIDSYTFGQLGEILELLSFRLDHINKPNKQNEYQEEITSLNSAIDYATRIRSIMSWKPTNHPKEASFVL
jgi:hypothetical protein